MDNRKLVVVFLAGAVAAAIVVLLATRIFSPGKSSEVMSSQEMEMPSAMEDLSARISQLKTTLAGNPNDVATLVQLGNLNYDSFQAQALTSFCSESIRYYEKALALKPGDPNVLTDLGYMYKCNGQVEQAIARFREAAKASPTHPQSRINLAITLFYEKGDLKGARAAAEDLLKINPEDQYRRNADLLILEIDKAEAEAKTPPAGK